MTENERTARAAQEAEIDAVLGEFGGDARKTIGALLHDLHALATDYAADVSRGFVRSEPPWGRPRRSRADGLSGPTSGDAAPRGRRPA